MKLIDLGAYNGDTALHFISYPDIDSIEAYEPNSDFSDIWAAIEKHYPNIIKFIPKAVFTHDGKITFYQRPPNLPLGSTVIDSKIQNDESLAKEVDCVDILDIIPNEPYCLKLDVEGAEYDILERIILNNKAHLIDRLYVEWHDSKMTSDNYARQIAIINCFKNRIKSWL